MEIAHTLETCHKTGRVAMIIGETGAGKTKLITDFCNKYPGDVVRVTVSKIHNLDDVIDDLYKAIGMDNTNLAGRFSKKRRLDAVATKLISIRKEGGKPVIIFDEAENLNPSVLAAVKGLYDVLVDYSSIVLIGTEQIITNILNLKQKNRTSLPQLYRRFKAYQRVLSPINKYVEYPKFFEKMKIADKGLQKLVMEMANNYGELHDYLEPVIRQADQTGKPVTEQLFRLYHDIPNLKKVS